MLLQVVALVASLTIVDVPRIVFAQFKPDKFLGNNVKGFRWTTVA
jgi:hypothetical protein